MPAGVSLVRSQFDQRLITALGFAGTLPFFICLMMIEQTWSLLLFKTYSLSILVFLAGAWWSTALMHRHANAGEVRLTLLLSNATVVLGVCAVVFTGNLALLALAALFGCLLCGERLLGVFRCQPGYYRRMRVVVTLVVITLHLITYGLLI